MDRYAAYHISIILADPDYFDEETDPDLTFHFDAAPDPSVWS
jgi:hypothetical protein